MKRKKIFCVFGTRPEAIKMAPVILKLREFPREFDAVAAVTAQHRDMLDQVLKLFALKPRYDLNIMRPGQTLSSVTSSVLEKLGPIFEREKPNFVLVHGDTTTALAAALAAFYGNIPVGHVEAGLRSGDMENPFPEEMNRRVVDALCALHFAPTETARRNLLKENISSKKIFVTGNTGIDALKMAAARLESEDFPAPPESLRRESSRPFVLMTVHRRENFGAPLENIFKALKGLARDRPSLRFLYPVHPNPNVALIARKRLGRLKNVRLLPPLDYGNFIFLLNRCLFVLTDSGGLQEEAPSLGKPVLVLRRVTERPEAVKAGTARVIGVETKNVEIWVSRLLDDARLFRSMSGAVNPYGDGKAAARISEVLRRS